MNVRNGHEFEKVLFLGLGICGNITLVVLLLATGFLRGDPTSLLLLDVSFFNLICLISMLVYFILMCGRTWRKANSSKKFLNISYDLWWYEVIVIPRTHSYSTTNTYTYIHTYMHACMHAYIHTYIHTCLLLLISMFWHRQAIFESKGDKLSSSECRIRTQKGLWNRISSRLNAHWQTDWAIEDQT